MRVRLGVLAVLVLVLASSACSGSGGPEASPSAESTTSPTGVPTAGGSQLTIVVEDGSGARTSWTLTCEPAAGTHPDPAGACAALADHVNALEPVPSDKMCAQVYGGPERATISGTWQGRPVSATLSRVDSCETARWDALVPLLPAGGR